VSVVVRNSVSSAARPVAKGVVVDKMFPGRGGLSTAEEVAAVNCRRRGGAVFFYEAEGRCFPRRPVAVVLGQWPQAAAIHCAAAAHLHRQPSVGTEQQ
jgi:hypothetical protein